MNLLAYIDAGTGSLIVQAIIATAVAVPFFLRSRIAGAVRRVRQLSGREPAALRGVDDRPRP